jgi:hypothetical protein
MGLFKKKGWIGVDLDKTLVKYTKWNNGNIGEPIPLMMDRVQAWLDQGIEVRIFTARCGNCYPDQVKKNCSAIQAFCLKHFHRLLPITNEKDQDMIALYDDRAVQMIPNTGQTLDQHLGIIRDYLTTTAKSLRTMGDYSFADSMDSFIKTYIDRK